MNGSETQFVDGILLLYHHPLRQSASTIMEHVNSFEQYSQFKVWKINVEFGFPLGLRELTFRILVLHYSLFGTWPYMLDEKFLKYIEQSQAYKIAFFQDEYRFCQPRFTFINRYKIDCIYTLLETAYFGEVYQKYTSVKKLVYTLPGYVSDGLIALGHTMTKSEKDRKIDIGYRGRRLFIYMGKGSQEKHEIGVKFLEQANGLGLKIDAEADERHRLYGRKWYEFMADCRAVLGVEAGASIFDLEDKVRGECERLISRNPRTTFEEVSKRILQPWEGNIPYRMISPRHFEAAALHVCQILFEGNYSGIMQAMVHYIPLKKDFSNAGDVIRMLRNQTLRSELAENAYCDLIASRRYSYKTFIESLDQELLKAGIHPSGSTAEFNGRVAELINRNMASRKVVAGIRSLAYLCLGGHGIGKRAVKCIMPIYKKLKPNLLQR
jgi:hypothetical protein